VMVTILKELTPTYYGGNLVGNMADQKVLEALLRHHLPACSESLQSNEVPAQSALTLPSHHALRLPGEHGYDRYTVAPLAVCQRIADRDGASCVGHFLPRWTGGLRLPLAGIHMGDPPWSSPPWHTLTLLRHGRR
jgi:hypothetical protein